jgi:hypothetical protein
MIDWPICELGFFSSSIFLSFHHRKSSYFIYYGIRRVILKCTVHVWWPRWVCYGVLQCAWAGCVSMCYDVFKSDVVWFTVLHCASLCFTVLHWATLCYTVLHCASLCFTVLHCASLCFTVLFSMTCIRNVVCCLGSGVSCIIIESRRFSSWTQASTNLTWILVI